MPVTHPLLRKRKVPKVHGAISSAHVSHRVTSRIGRGDGCDTVVEITHGATAVFGSVPVSAHGTTSGTPIETAIGAVFPTTRTTSVAIQVASGDSCVCGGDPAPIITSSQRTAPPKVLQAIPDTVF